MHTLCRSLFYVRRVHARQLCTNHRLNHGGGHVTPRFRGGGDVNVNRSPQNFHFLGGVNVPPECSRGDNVPPRIQILENMPPREAKIAMAVLKQMIDYGTVYHN